MIGSLDRFRFDLHRFRFISAAAAAAIALAACGGSGSDGPPPALSVSTTSIDAGIAGGNVSVGVSNSGGGTLNWTAAVPAGVDWARISAGSSGSNAGTIQVEVDANTGAARDFELTVSASGAASQAITISQPEAPAMLDLTVAGTELSGDGGSVSVQVRNSGHTSMQWTASLPGDVNWAYIESGESGADSGEVVVRYDLNGGQARDLEVTVTAASASNSPQSLEFSQDWFGVSACTYDEARAEVFELLEAVYYFNDEPEQAARYDQIVLDEFSDLDALLDEVRWMPETRDRGFTYWLTQEESDMLFSAESYIFGFRMIVIVDQSRQPLYLQMLDVYEGSPAAEAGLERGDKIQSLNGKAVNGLSLDELSLEFGPNEDGFVLEVEVEKLSGATVTRSMAKRLVEIRTVPEEHATVFDTDAGKVGYLHFRTFFGDANERLLDEFAGFKSQGVSHLIIDLRYNGGGSVAIANGLATLIGGPELFESAIPTVLARTIHNSYLKRRGWDRITHFGCDAYGSPAQRTKCRNESALRDLENVVFITSSGSASASELVITALQPHENVALAGERTYGKPVGQYGFDFCLANPDDNDSGLGILWPVSFATVNSEGFEEYYEGIPVTTGCEVEDDRSHKLGDAREGRIAAALRFIETGSCAPASSSRLTAQDAVFQIDPARDPVTQFLGY